MFAKVYCRVQNVLLVSILQLYQTLHFFTLNLAYRSELSSLKIAMIQKFSERDFESGVLTCPRLLQLVNENDLFNDLVITDAAHFELPGSIGVSNLSHIDHWLICMHLRRTLLTN